MALFLSTYTNKVDKKGRVSVPAGFRSAVASENFTGIVVYPSFIHPCVEACSMSRLEKISESIDNLDPFSEERDAFATSILGQAQQLAFDSDGRVLLPAVMIEAANIMDQATFVGKGQTFEIWAPAEFEKYRESAQKLAKSQRGMLRMQKGGSE